VAQQVLLPTVPSHLEPERPDLSGAGTNEADLQWICRETLRAAFPAFRSAEIRASFYPYIGLTHTIRRRHGVWILRLSDHLRQAPRTVLEAVALLLASKVARSRPSRDAERTYARYRRESHVRERLEARRRKRGSKRIDSSDGRHHSLSVIFKDLNRRFFGEKIEVEKVGWGPRRSATRLGHYDPIHLTITISPILDDAHVPEEVVGFIVYHEMLHVLFSLPPGPSGRRRYHPPAFRSTERAYPGFERCERFLREFCSRRRRRLPRVVHR